VVDFSTMATLPAFSFLAMLFGTGALWVQQEPDVWPHSPKHSMWVLEKSAPAEHHVTLTVALKLEEGRRAELEKTFWEVSDPKHEKYGRHLSISGITELLAVPVGRVDAVKEYFELAGAASIQVAPNRDMITVTMPVVAAEKALKTKLGFFLHSDRPDVRIVRATDTYSLPAAIAQHVVLVGELLQFPQLPLPKLTSLKGQGSWPNACSAKGCEGLVTPEVLAERYKLPKLSSSNAKGNSMAVAEFTGQWFKDSDLSNFSKS
jgi:tripeptidyl-peptidase-1